MDQAGDELFDQDPINEADFDNVSDYETDLFLASIGRSKRDYDHNPPMLNLEWTKAYTFQDFLNQIPRTVLSHPSSYMTTLVQLGFEPLPGQIGKSIFGRAKLRLPGFFSYMGHIVEKDGFMGMYRGLRFSLAFSVSYEFVYKNVLNLQEKIELFEPVIKEPEVQFDNAKNLALGLVSETLARTVALCVAYPFKVVTVRCMAQYIGGESTYDWFWEAMRDLYQTGGLSAFYSGLVPFLLADCLFTYTRWISFYLARDKWNRNSRNIFSLLTIYLANSLSYPMRVVSTIMSCNGTSARSLAASNYTAPAFDHWVQCMKDLCYKGELSRGSSLYWRSRPFNPVNELVSQID